MILQQDTPEWLQKRKECVTASDIPVIMGLSPYMTPYQLWQEKVGLSEPCPTNSAMQRGKDLEVVARKHLEKTYDIKLENPCVFHPDHPWLMASLDAYGDNPGVWFKRLLAEIKCLCLEKHQNALAGKIDPMYLYQMQAQMLITGMDVNLYCSYYPGHSEEYALLSVQREESVCQEILKAAMAFYRCMTLMEPPELSERDYRTREDETWNRHARSFLNLKSQIKQLEESLEQEKRLLIDLSGGLPTQGCGLKISKSQRAGNVDYTKVPELKGVNLDAYRKPFSEFWKVCIV